MNVEVGTRKETGHEILTKKMAETEIGKDSPTHWKERKDRILHTYCWKWNKTVATSWTSGTWENAWGGDATEKGKETQITSKRARAAKQLASDTIKVPNERGRRRVTTREITHYFRSDVPSFTSVLCCVVLCCITLYCIVICIVLCCIALHCIVLCCITLYCIVLYCVCIVLYCMVLIGAFISIFSK